MQLPGNVLSSVKASTESRDCVFVHAIPNFVHVDLKHAFLDLFRFTNVFTVTYNRICCLQAYSSSCPVPTSLFELTYALYHSTFLHKRSAVGSDFFTFLQFTVTPIIVLIQ